VGASAMVSGFGGTDWRSGGRRGSGQDDWAFVVARSIGGALTWVGLLCNGGTAMIMQQGWI